MKPYRVLVVLAVVLMVLAAVRFWSRRPALAGAATPMQCLENYYESLKSGNIAKYLRCLDEPYRTEGGQRLFEAACREVKDMKGLAQRAGPMVNEASVWIDVEEIRTTGVRRLRYHLRQDNGNWVIVTVDPPRETPAAIRYGTPVNDEP